MGKFSYVLHSFLHLSKVICGNLFISRRWCTTEKSKSGSSHLVKARIELFPHVSAYLSNSAAWLYWLISSLFKGYVSAKTTTHIFLIHKPSVQFTEHLICAKFRKLRHTSWPSESLVWFIDESHCLACRCYVGGTWKKCGEGQVVIWGAYGNILTWIYNSQGNSCTVCIIHASFNHQNPSEID